MQSQPDLKVRFESIAQEINTRENTYIDHAPKYDLHLLPKDEVAIGSVTNKELVKVYTDRMAKEKAAGYSIYSRIMVTQGDLKMCPYCGTRPFNTLDHFLPESRYPAYVVTPCNLIPSCSECNKEKHADVPSSQNDHYIHPYFDDDTSSEWVIAELDATWSAVSYRTTSPTHWSPEQLARAQHHFDQLKLAELYATYSADELACQKLTLTSLTETAGIDITRLHLEKQLEAARSINVNSWKAPLYRAILNSLPDFLEALSD
ncbi:HNH endonuclease [Rubritalea profundi]|nr:HNH endonuclease [Rubritalea profundi]